MAKKKIFVSFDFGSDRSLKNEIVAQSQNEGSNFKVANWSMKPDNIDGKWLKEAKYHITRCDALVILIGENTHNAEGVRRELEIAKSAGKSVIPLLAHPQNSPVENTGEAHDWTAEKLQELLK